VKTLVLLHGWGMTPSILDEVGDRLRGACEIHALPLPGYCGTPGVAPYTVETLAQSAAARAPRRCVVAGWSLGGQVALEWARRAPEQVEALVLIGSTPSFVTRVGWPHAVEPAVFRGFAEAMTSNRDSTLKRFASLQAQGDAAMKPAAMRLRAALCAERDASTPTLCEGLRVLLDADLRAALAHVEQPVLVIHGENDRLVPLAAGEHLARAMKRAQLLKVPGAAHAPFVTQPDAVVDAIAGFVR
jgi:pimeloyl-[acyl-carrier protein] methyl ester esterase